MVSPRVNCKYMVSPIGNKGWELHILEGLSQLSTELDILEGLQRPFQMQILLANESTHLQKVRTQRKLTILSFLEREQTASLRSLAGSLPYRRTWCRVLSSRAIFRRPLSILSGLSRFYLVQTRFLRCFPCLGSMLCHHFVSPLGHVSSQPHCSISLVPWLQIRLKKRFQNPNGQLVGVTSVRSVWLFRIFTTEPTTSVFQVQ